MLPRIFENCKDESVKLWNSTKLIEIIVPFHLIHEQNLSLCMNIAVTPKWGTVMCSILVVPYKIYKYQAIKYKNSGSSLQFPEIPFLTIIKYELQL